MVSLTAKEGTYKNDPIGILDVTILQENFWIKFWASMIREPINELILLAASGDWQNWKKE